MITVSFPDLRNSHRMLRRPLTAFALGTLCMVTSMVASAVDLIDGKALYTAPAFQNTKSCADSSCHGPDPSTNQNRVRSAANFPSAIINAIQQVPEMLFLRDRGYSSRQFADLAAYIADPRPSSVVPVATLSLPALNFDPVNLGATSSTRIVTLTNTGTVPLQLSAISLSSREFARVLGTCASAAVLAPFASCSLGLAFTPEAVGARTGFLTLSHNGYLGGSTLPLSGTGVAVATNATRPMIEYRNNALDYYFLTARANEIALLDARPDWSRTGKSFNVYTASLNGEAGINRYYFDQIAVAYSRGSHFYTLSPLEKEGLQRLNPGNGETPGLPFNEGIDSYAVAPLVEGIGGGCASGLLPVYRLFRGQTRFPDNPNHRFTTDTVLYNSFVAAGWDGEGVKLCVPK